MIIERTPERVVRRVDDTGAVLFSRKPPTTRVRCACGCEILLKQVGRTCPNCSRSYSPQGALV